MIGHDENENEMGIVVKNIEIMQEMEEAETVGENIEKRKVRCLAIEECLPSWI